MDEDLNKKEYIQAALIGASLVSPLIGFGIALWFWVKNNRALAKKYFWCSLLGVVITGLLYFVKNEFSLHNSLMNLSLHGFKSAYIGGGFIVAFLVFEFVEDISVKRMAIISFITSLAFVAISALRIESLTNFLAAVPQTAVLILTYVILQKRMKKWLAFALGLIISFVWVLILFSIVGVLFNI
ncbi:hypothetical protein IMAU30046_01332 [Lactobacillus helveticus]|uniref:hypothetical protein n=1 Tax=Lactobacillus helveticus TaxID=1587 RepID=UPI00156289F9|nr:hypothetical protein [Lactobacillus helveticus]NRO12666.1 hypothetical protein [Lactobacillus helveticus]